jgi:phage-related holin
VDFITGIIASKKEGKDIKSNSWGKTINKLIGVYLYAILATFIFLFFSVNYVVLTLIFTPLVLSLLKEYISIGENMERRFGNKPYLFKIVDKIFDLLESKFFKNLEHYINGKNKDKDT